MKARVWHVRVFVPPSAWHRACNKNTHSATISHDYMCMALLNRNRESAGPKASTGRE